MYYYLGSHRLAEKTLRDAAKINPYAPETWFVVILLHFQFTMIQHFFVINIKFTGTTWEKY